MTVTLQQIAINIVREQELVIGPLAWIEAMKVRGIQVNREQKELLILNGDPKETVDRLVAQYEHLFGLASKEVCKEAASALIADLPETEIPNSLR
jgi:hypothetical protein